MHPQSSPTGLGLFAETILDRQVLDLPSEFVVGGAGDQMEDRVKEAGHGGGMARPGWLWGEQRFCTPPRTAAGLSTC
jgi:hypothetical protein